MISRENVKKPRTAYFFSALYFPSPFLKNVFINKQNYKNYKISI